MGGSDVVTGGAIDFTVQSQDDVTQVSGNEFDELVIEPGDASVVDYEELLQEMDAASGSQEGYTLLLQEIHAEQLVTNQYLYESIEYQKQIVESMKLVNTFFYILFIFIVGVIGYKIMSWLI